MERGLTNLLSDENIAEVIDHMVELAAIRPTPTQVRGVIEPWPALARLITETGVAGDTDTREQVSNVFCRALTGRDWPEGRDKIDKAMFYTSLWLVAQASGYAIEKSVEEDIRQWLTK